MKQLQCKLKKSLKKINKMFSALTSTISTSECEHFKILIILNYNI